MDITFPEPGEYKVKAKCGESEEELEHTVYVVAPGILGDVNMDGVIDDADTPEKDKEPGRMVGVNTRTHTTQEGDTLVNWKSDRIQGSDEKGDNLKRLEISLAPSVLDEGKLTLSTTGNAHVRIFDDSDVAVIGPEAGSEHVLAADDVGEEGLIYHVEAINGAQAVDLEVEYDHPDMDDPCSDVLVVSTVGMGLSDGIQVGSLERAVADPIPDAGEDETYRWVAFFSKIEEPNHPGFPIINLEDRITDKVLEQLEAGDLGIFDADGNAAVSLEEEIKTSPEFLLLVDVLQGLWQSAYEFWRDYYRLLGYDDPEKEALQTVGDKPTVDSVYVLYLQVLDIDEEQAEYYWQMPAVYSPGEYTYRVKKEAESEEKVSELTVRVVENTLEVGGVEIGHGGSFAHERAIVMVNDGFLEGNLGEDGYPVPDYRPDHELGHQVVVGEDSPVAEGFVGMDGADPDREGKWTLTYDEENVMLWLEEDEGEYTPLESGDQTETVSADESFHFFVEGIEASESVHDVNLEAKFEFEEMDIETEVDGPLTVAQLIVYMEGLFTKNDDDLGRAMKKFAGYPVMLNDTMETGLHYPDDCEEWEPSNKPDTAEKKNVRYDYRPYEPILDLHYIGDAPEETNLRKITFDFEPKELGGSVEIGLGNDENENGGNDDEEGALRFWESDKKGRENLIEEMPEYDVGDLDKEIYVEGLHIDGDQLSVEYEGDETEREKKIEMHVVSLVEEQGNERRIINKYNEAIEFDIEGIKPVQSRHDFGYRYSWLYDKSTQDNDSDEDWRDTVHVDFLRVTYGDEDPNWGEFVQLLRQKDNRRQEYNIRTRIRRPDGGTVLELKRDIRVALDTFEGTALDYEGDAVDRQKEVGGYENPGGLIGEINSHTDHLKTPPEGPHVPGSPDIMTQEWYEDEDNYALTRVINDGYRLQYTPEKDFLGAVLPEGRGDDIIFHLILIGTGHYDLNSTEENMKATITHENAHIDQRWFIRTNESDGRMPEGTYQLDKETEIENVWRALDDLYVLPDNYDRFIEADAYMQGLICSHGDWRYKITGLNPLKSHYVDSKNELEDIADYDREDPDPDKVEIAVRTLLQDVYLRAFEGGDGRDKFPQFGHPGVGGVPEYELYNEMRPPEQKKGD